VISMCVHFANRSLPRSAANHREYGMPRTRVSSRASVAAVSCMTLGLMFVTSLSAQAQVGGIYIDAAGLLRQATDSSDEQLAVFRDRAVNDVGDNSVRNTSPLRKISLRRLIETIQQANGQALTSEVRYLAGLTRVQYVLFYPETRDVVLAGPAESWMQLATGEVVGRKSQRPVLHLDDLVIALRFAVDRNNPDGFIGCSIEPTEQGLRRLDALMRRRSSRIERGQVRQTINAMQQALGSHQVKFYGVPEDSVFALKLLAADYRLKRIALGHDTSPVKQVRNYLDLEMRRFRNGPQPQHRWWFVGKYEALRHSADQLAFEFVGSGLEVRTGPSQESAEAKGAVANRSARDFADQFTRHLPEIAARIPVFAELQNLVSLAVASQLIADRDASGVPSIDLRPLRADDVFRPAKRPVPQRVGSLAGSRLVRGKHWLISISGGVDFDPRQIAESANWQQERAGTLGRQHATQQPTSKKHWWWD